MADTATPAPQTTQTPTTLLSDLHYNLLKQAGLIVLPAISALYLALAQIWGLPAGEKVASTVAALNLFVGAFVTFARYVHQVSGAAYDGVVNVTVDPESGKKTFSLEVNGDPDELDQKASITFKVNAPPAD